MATWISYNYFTIGSIWVDSQEKNNKRNNHRNNHKLYIHNRTRDSSWKTYMEKMSERYLYSLDQVWLRWLRKLVTHSPLGPIKMEYHNPLNRLDITIIYPNSSRWISYVNVWALKVNLFCDQVKTNPTFPPLNLTWYIFLPTQNLIARYLGILYVAPIT